MILKSRADWGARPPAYTNRLNFNIVDKFIVHYSGASRTQTIRSIQDYSMDTKGYSDIDYNYIVKDGIVYTGRGDNIGGHTLNNNSSSYGVCVVGRDGDATDADMIALIELHAVLTARVGRQLRKTTHRGVLGAGYTDCPGSELDNWVKAGMPHPTGSGDDLDMFAKLGDKGEKVGLMQVRIVEAGGWIGPKDALDRRDPWRYVDNDFGPNTAEGLRQLIGDPNSDGTDYNKWMMAALDRILREKDGKPSPIELVGRELTMTAKITQAS